MMPRSVNPNCRVAKVRKVLKEWRNGGGQEKRRRHAARRKRLSAQGESRHVGRSRVCCTRTQAFDGIHNSVCRIRSVAPTRLRLNHVAAQTKSISRLAGARYIRRAV